MDVPQASPIGIYVHLPFCTRRCTYCAFAISTRHGREDAYITSLIREISSVSTLHGTPVDTLYFGGGTPSKTCEANLRALFDALNRHFDLTRTREVTLEANPEDVDARSIDLWASLGVTRLSIGVQSMIDSELEALGRVHDHRSSASALEIASKSGLRISADLILGFPGQSVASVRASLDAVIESGAGHISLYLLDIEQGSAIESRLRRDLVHLPPEHEAVAMYLETVETAVRAGFHQYEVSNLARSGQESLHNLRYWSRAPYRGFGLGAHSLIGSRRFANTRHLETYIDQAGRTGQAITFSEDLGPTEIREERLLLGLRQADGLAYDELRELAGDETDPWLRRGLENGWLQESAHRIALTPSGFLVSNELIADLF